MNLLHRLTCTSPIEDSPRGHLIRPIPTKNSYISLILLALIETILLKTSLNYNLVHKRVFFKSNSHTYSIV